MLNFSTKKSKLKIIPLGGVEEVGKNCMVLEFGSDIIVIDLGLDFPGPDFPGIRYILPDISYLEKNKKRIKGILITHGHLDHIGALSFVMDKIGNPPIFATKLTAELIKSRFAEIENKNKQRIKVQIINPDKNQTVNLGNFKIDCFWVCHNIPDSVGFAVHTPLGTVIHTGDFKFDQHPINQLTDTAKIKQLCSTGALALISDSTNAEEPGRVISESEVGRIIDQLFANTQQRIIFTTFSTLISRIQQVIDIAQKYQRKIAVAGYSINQSIILAQQIGYLNIPPNLLVDIAKIKQIPDQQLVILASGTQGEERSAMTKIANGEYHAIKIKTTDTVIFSASAIPGNELAVRSVMNHLIDLGVKIIYQPALGLGVHSSGHACQEDLKEMIQLVRPKFFIPEHGEHLMQVKHIKLAVQTGIPRKNCFMLSNGDTLALDQQQGRILKTKLAQQTLVVEYGQAKILQPDIITERRNLAQAGIYVVIISLNRTLNKIHKIDIATRGLELESKVIDELKNKIRQKTKILIRQNKKNLSLIEKKLTVIIKSYIYSRTKKKSLVIVRLNK